MNNRYFASSQLIFGLVALFFVAVSYFKFNSLLNEIFIDLANTYGIEKNHSEVLGKVIGESVKATGEWLKVSNSSADGCASEATVQAFSSIRSELPKIADMISNAALIASSVEKTLPLSIPSVAEHEKKIKIPIYSTKIGAQTIDMPFYEIKKIPSADEKKVSYINNISVQTKKMDIVFHSCNEQVKLVPGKKEKNPFEQVTDIFKCGNETPPVVSTECQKTVKHLEYITKITPKREYISSKNPDEILITKSNKPISVATPQISVKEQSISVKEVKVSTNRIMEKEKELLNLLTKQLKAMSTLPGVADGWIQFLQKELERCPAQPHSEEAKKIIEAFHKSLTDLQSKIKTPEQHLSAEGFKAAAEFLPYLFLILGLLSAGMAASGGAKLFVKRNNKTNKGGNGQKQGCGGYNEAVQVQQESLSQNLQQSMCQQSAHVEQQQR